MNMSEPLVAHLSCEIKEIPIELSANTAHSKTSPVEVKVFPDSGASICLAGPQHLEILNIKRQLLTPCNKQVRAVGGSTLTCFGWIPITFSINHHSTVQHLYICEKVDRIYLSRKACTALNILPNTFPFPMDHISSVDNTPSLSLPRRPEKIPFTPTEDNVLQLKQYLLNEFSNTTFNREGPFPVMKAKPAHIHINSDAKPHVKHTPIPIPFNLKQSVKKSLDDDVLRGIIAPVPIRTPVEWCTTMVIAQKKNGSIRRTVDLQHLNKQCKRETHHCPSPFQLACQVPANTKKTVFDAVDGYHAIPLDEESQHLTTFITEWGRYRYLRMPQGFLASGDAYTSRYDDIIKDIPRKVKCVDDTLLYDTCIEDAFYKFYRAWDHLQLCWDKGIVLNPDKFQFCVDTANFAGLRITPTGISPSEPLLSSICDFPIPKDITDARSWFGLVNQVAWAYSISPIMQPFRTLVKHNSRFYWDDILDKLFSESKKLLLSAVQDGIRSFDYKRTTCLQTDWSKDGIGYLLLQKYCECDNGIAPICCNEGWQLIYAESRFTTETESRYAPTEGEALAVAWSLEHAKMFVLGCNNLIITTDHRPLLGIFSDRDLGTVTNPRLQKLKGRTLRFKFSMQYCPGKWLRGPDAMSRNPSAIASIEPTWQCLNPIRQAPSAQEIILSFASDIDVTANVMAAIDSFRDVTNAIQLVTLDQIRQCATSSDIYSLLYKTINNGFPTNRSNLPAELRPYWEVRHRLSCWEGIAMLDNRLLIPPQLHHTVLQALHSAHQGCTGMQNRANDSIYWPGLNRDIHRVRDNCKTCTAHSPSQSKEPITPTPPPQYPFQMITGDYFMITGHHYLVIVDRFSGWICVYHFGTNEATSATLISICRTLFTTYGVSEEFGSDGGPQLTSNSFQTFLKNWGVHHRLSSAEYPQSNGRAELGVKAAKRIIYDNVSSNGRIDNDKVARAILQYRNTPLPNFKLSPAQILFHRQLRDHVPAHPSRYHLHSSWLLTAKRREEEYSKRNHVLVDKYNRHARPLQPLPVGTNVIIQNRGKKNPRQWLRTGRIVEALPHRQYRIKMDGSGRVTLQNRRFIRVATFITPFIIPSPTSIQQTDHLPPPSAPVQPPTDNITQPLITLPLAPVPETDSLPLTSTESTPVLPTSLRRLLTFNKPGLGEQQPLPPRRKGNNNT